MYHTGVPSPPANLSSTVTTSSPSVKVEWDPPLYRGHRQGIILYVITIKAINYTRSKIVNSTRRNSHIIQGGGETMIEFNKNYVVSVTTVGVCKVDSDPARISMRIEASGKYLTSKCTIFNHIFQVIFTLTGVTSIGVSLNTEKWVISLQC